MEAGLPLTASLLRTGSYFCFWKVCWLTQGFCRTAGLSSCWRQMEVCELSWYWAGGFGVLKKGFWDIDMAWPIPMSLVYCLASFENSTRGLIFAILRSLSIFIRFWDGSCMPLADTGGFWEGRELRYPWRRLSLFAPRVVFAKPWRSLLILPLL